MRPPAVSRLWTISENPDECYTLLVDGADESHFNPNFDWSRHLPSEVHIDRREHDRHVLAFTNSKDYNDLDGFSI